MTNCTIRILNEVECVVLGLEDKHSKELKTRYSPFAEGYFFSKKYKMGIWDGRISFYSAGGRTYVKLLPEIIPQVVKWGYKLELVDNRTPINLQIPVIDENIFVDQGIILGDHQVKAANAIFKNGGGIVRAATGSGKSFLAAAIAKQYNDVHNLKTIMIVPNSDLVTQGIEDFQNLDLDVGEYSGDKKDLNHPIVISTWQSLQNNPKVMELFDVALVDECIHPTSLVWTPNGQIPINELKVGDTVINYDEDNNIFKCDEIVEVHKNLTISSTEKMYQLQFSNDEIIKVTGNHKFLTNGGWKRADELSTNDIIKNNTPDDVILISRIEIDKSEIVYNLHIKNDHNYIVHGMIVANCHGAKGSVIKSLLNDAGSHLYVRIGVTGTLPKAEVDSLSVKISLGEEVYSITAKELIDSGWLSEVDIQMLELEENFKSEYNEFKKAFPVESEKMTYAKFLEHMFPDYDSEKKYLGSNKARTNFIARLIELKRLEEKGNSLVLVNSIDTGKKYQKLIEGSYFVYSKDKKAARKEIYRLFNTHDNIVVIATSQLASTGLNIPRIFNLFFIDMGKSYIRTIQSVGRGLRKAHDKTKILVIDIYSNLKYSKDHKNKRVSHYKEAQYPYTIRKIDYKG